MDLTLLWQALPYIAAWAIGIFSTLPFGRWILHLKGIPQIIARYSEQITIVLEGDSGVPEDTKKAIYVLLKWIRKIVEIQPINTSAGKTEETLKRTTKLMNGESK